MNKKNIIADEKSDAKDNIKKHQNRSQSFHQHENHTFLPNSFEQFKYSTINPLKKQATLYDSAVKIKLSQLSEHQGRSISPQSYERDSPMSSRRKKLHLNSLVINNDENLSQEQKKSIAKFLSQVSSPGLMVEKKALKKSATIKKPQNLEVIQESDFQQIVGPSQDSQKISSEHMSEAKKIQLMHFESPKNRQSQINSNSNTNTEGNNNMGSYVDSTINPLESPDHLPQTLRQGHKFQESSGGELKLRTNRISEVPNENSDCDASSPIKDLKVLDSTPDVYTSQLLNKGLRKTYSNQRDLISSSLDRFMHLQAFNGLDKQNEEVQLLKTQLREDKAKFVKQKAILEQQVELLTMQLHEASEREKCIKKTYTSMMQALQIKKQSSEASDYSLTKDPKFHMQDSGKRNSSSSPFRGQSSPFRGSTSPVKQKSLILQEAKKSADSPQSDYKNLIEELKDQVKILEQNVATGKLQIKTQDQLLMQKEDQIIELKRLNNQMQKELESQSEIRLKEIMQIEQKQGQEMKKRIEINYIEMERQMRSKCDGFQDKERYLNEKIIDLQKDLQNVNSELDSQMKIVHLKGLRCLELEKQVYFHENQLETLKRENERIIQEGNSRITQLVQEMEKMNSNILKLKKQASEKRDQALKDPQATTSAQEEDGTNKFITSPNDSMRNEEEQHPDYSFGDLQRLSLLTPQDYEQTPSENIQINVKDSQRQSQQLPFIAKQFSSSSSKKKLDKSKSKTRQSKSPLGSIPKKKVTDMQQPQSKPVKVKYWQKDEKFIDDGTCSEETTNALRRLVADLRSQLSKLTVAYNDLKSSSQKEIQRLKGLVDFEKKRRVVAQEDKLEKSSTLMQELVERDKKIVEMQSKIHDMNDEKLEMESINQTYFGLAGGYGGAGPDKSLSVYQSQQLYGTKGAFKNSGVRGSVSRKRSSVMSSASVRSLGGSMTKITYDKIKMMSARKNSTPFIDNQYGLQKINKLEHGVDFNNYLTQRENGPVDKKMQLEIPELSTPLGNVNVQGRVQNGIQSPTNDNSHRLLTMKSLDQGNFQKFLSPNHLSKINQNVRKSEVAEILQANGVLVDNTQIKSGCTTSRMISGCKKGVGIEQELVRNSLPQRQIQRTPNPDLQFDDTQYQNHADPASSEINMLTQSNDQNWWTDRLETQKLQQAIENGDNSRLFSPLSSMHNRAEFTPLGNIQQDDLKQTVKKMQLGLAKSQVSLMQQAQQIKKTHFVAEDSEDDCNVDADVGEEYTMTLSREKKPENFQERKDQPLQEQSKKMLLTQRQNVNANKVPPLAMTKLHESIENNQMAQSMRLRGAINTPLSNTSFITQRNKFQESNQGSFQNPSSMNNTIQNPQDMSASQARSALASRPMQVFKSPLTQKRITPSPSYYNQYNTQVPKKVKTLGQTTNSMSLKSIFNQNSTDGPKKLNVGPTQSIYNTIKQKQSDQKTGRSSSKGGSIDPNRRGSINMSKVFKPQNSNTVMAHKNYQQK